MFFNQKINSKILLKAGCNAKRFTVKHVFGCAIITVRARKNIQHSNLLRLCLVCIVPYNIFLKYFIFNNIISKLFKNI